MRVLKLAKSSDGKLCFLLHGLGFCPLFINILIILIGTCKHFEKAPQFSALGWKRLFTKLIIIYLQPLGGLPKDLTL
jgi:putative exporter of polyketide antibiotics